VRSGPVPPEVTVDGRARADRPPPPAPAVRVRDSSRSAHSSRCVAGTDHCLVARTRELAPDLARTTQLAALAVNSGCELLPPQYDTAGKWGRLDLSKALRAIRLPTVPVTA